MNNRTRARLATCAAAVLTVGTAITGGTGAQASAGCTTGWGSLSKGSRAMAAATVEGVRSGRHACFDRLVVDLDGKAPRAAFDARYVRSVRADGSGHVVPLRGRAYLQLVVRAPAYDERGRATYVPANRREVVPVSGYRTLRQVAWAGSFEGQTSLGVGVRARLPFRVTVLDGPGTGSRVVLDVAHSW